MIKERYRPHNFKENIGYDYSDDYEEEPVEIEDEEEDYYESKKPKFNESIVILNEAIDIKGVIKELIDTSWSGDNESQMKSVQLLKGLATSDDSASNKFMKALDKFTDGLKVEDFS